MKKKKHAHRHTHARKTATITTTQQGNKRDIKTQSLLFFTKLQSQNKLSVPEKSCVCMYVHMRVRSLARTRARVYCFSFGPNRFFSLLNSMEFLNGAVECRDRRVWIFHILCCPALCTLWPYNFSYVVIWWWWWWWWWLNNFHIKHISLVCGARWMNECVYAVLCCPRVRMWLTIG